MIHALIDWLGSLYDQYGYLIVFLGALGENTAFLGLILPGGTLALLGAFYARAGTLNIGWVIFFAWIGTVLGYHVDYLVGRFLLGPLRPGVERQPAREAISAGGQVAAGPADAAQVWRQDDLYLPRHRSHTLVHRPERRHDSHALPPLFGV